MKNYKRRRLWAWLLVFSLIAMTFVPYLTTDSFKPAQVYAVTGQTNLANFPEEVELKDAGGGDVDQANGVYSVKADTRYQFKIKFSEVNGKNERQMASSDSDAALKTLYYNLPDGITFTNGFHGKAIIDVTPPGGNESSTYQLYKCTYDVDGSQLKFTWDYTNNGGYTADKVEGHLSGSEETYFWVNLEGVFDGSKTTIDFSEEAHLTVEITDDRDLTVDKAIESYNAYNGTIDYTVTVTSEGNNKNVNITDVIANAVENGLTIVPNSISAKHYAKGDNTGHTMNSTEFTSTVASDDKSFDARITELGDGERAVITYSVKVDPDKFPAITQSGSSVVLTTTNDTENKVSVTSEKVTTAKTAKVSVSDQVKHPAITKSVTPSEIDTTGGGEYDADYTIVLKTYHDINAADLTIEDVFTEHKELVTSITDFKVMKQVNTWIPSEWGGSVSNGTAAEYNGGEYYYNSTDKTWTYHLPDTEIPSENQEYVYTITYTAKLNADGLNEKVDVDNEVTLDKFGTGKGTVTIGPKNPDIKKVVGEASYNYTEWTVTIEVPETGIITDGDVYLEDEFPSHSYYDSNNNYALTTFRDSLVGGLDGIQVVYSAKGVAETCTKELTDHGIKIKFMNGTVSGFAALSDRTVTITYTTKNNEDWLAAAAADNYFSKVHTNTATLHVKNRSYPDEASVTPMQRIMEKNFVEQIDYTWQVHTFNASSLSYNIEEHRLPAFRYEIILSNLADSCFNDNDQILITDTFDSRYLALCDTTSSEWSWGEDYITYDDNVKYDNKLISYNIDPTGYFNSNSKYAEADTSTDGTVVFKINKSDLELDSGSYYSYYKLTYYLQIKDQAAYLALSQAAADEEDHTVELSNSAVSEGFSSMVAVAPYTYQMVDKEQLTDWGGSTRTTTFRIVINPAGIDLDPNSDELILTDTYNKISIDFDSIQVDPEDGVTYDASGNTLIFTVPDNRKITITYQAYIIGTGNVSYSNYATLLGQSSGEGKTVHFTSSGAGGASAVGIVVMKYTGGNMRDVLSGVTFQLYDGESTNPNPEPLKEYTTGDDGKAVIVAASSDSFSILREHAYYLVEKEAKPGYKRDTTKYYFKIPLDEDTTELYTSPNWYYRNHDVMTVKNETEELSIPVKKVWEGAVGTKAEFELYTVSASGTEMRAKDTGGVLVPKLTITAAENWKGTFTNLPRYDEKGTMLTYRVKEVNIPDGYVSDGGARVDNSTAARIDKGFIFTNTQAADSDLQFNKVSLYNETCALNGNATKALQGVVFGVYAASAPDVLITRATSNSVGKVVFRDLDPGDYLVRELETVDNHILDTTIYYATVTNDSFTGLTLADGSAVPDNTLINDKYRADIQLLKVNESHTSERLAKSRYGLYKKNASGADTMIASTVTDDDGRLVFEGVLTGIDYTIKELEAPDGYYVSKNPITLKFKVDENGKVVMDTAAIDTGNGTIFVSQDGSITWLEPQVIARFLKVDADGKALGGAKLHIEDADGNQVADWISSSEAYELSGVLNCGQSYRLVEDQAPKGYQLADPITFEIPEKMGPDEGYVVTVSMTDEKEDITTTASTTTEVSTASTSDVTTATTATTTTATSVNTGDSASLVLALILLLASAGGLLCMDLFRHRSSK